MKIDLRYDSDMWQSSRSNCHHIGTCVNRYETDSPLWVRRMDSANMVDISMHCNIKQWFIQKIKREILDNKMKTSHFACLKFALGVTSAWPFIKNKSQSNNLISFERFHKFLVNISKLAKYLSDYIHPLWCSRLENCGHSQFVLLQIHWHA